MGTNWDKQGNYQKYNSDGSTPVMVVGSLAKQIAITITTPLDALGEDVVYDSGNVPVSIDILEWATNSANKTQLRFFPYVNGVPMGVGPGVIKSDGGGVDGFYADKINSNVSSIIDVLVYDSTNSKYKFSIKDLVYPEGLKITRRNIDTVSAFNCAVYLQGRSV